MYQSSDLQKADNYAFCDELGLEIDLFGELGSCRVYFQMMLLSYYRVFLFLVTMMLVILRAVQVEQKIRLRGSSDNSVCPRAPVRPL